ncbi:hypothetical protein C0J52_07571 [Blattella germanica]|nr:hypothetical protein C0J52_07571 [Blattella germanica]
MRTFNSIKAHQLEHALLREHIRHTRKNLANPEESLFFTKIEHPESEGKQAAKISPSRRCKQPTEGNADSKSKNQLTIIKSKT